MTRMKYPSTHARQGGSSVRRVWTPWLVILAAAFAGCADSTTARVLPKAASTSEALLRESPFEQEGEIQPFACAGAGPLPGPCYSPPTHNPATLKLTSQGEPWAINGTLSRLGDPMPCELRVSLQVLLPGAEQLEHGGEDVEGEGPLAFSYDITRFPRGTEFVLGADCNWGWFGEARASGGMPQKYRLEGALTETAPQDSGPAEEPTK